MTDQDEHLRLPLAHSARVFTGGYLQVDREEYVHGSRRQVREIVRVKNGVCVLAVTRDGLVPVVTQFRASTGRILSELPAGVVDPGEEPLEAARRELSEEAGVTGGEWFHLRHYAQAEGYSSGWMDIYLALDCHRGESHPEEGEELVLRFLPLRELLDHMPFQDAKSMLCLLLSRPILGARGLV
ncbi:MAG: NUDIX hydrolase [Fibrobacteria bacterium]|nr:NUDIX hydrolase [Fibrobacteria bacterium]